jgi:Putative Actinobacterial Holin-X, holin superfamily III
MSVERRPAWRSATWSEIEPRVVGMTVESTPQAEPSIAELVSQLSAQTSRLVRDEMRLAQTGFRDAAKHAGLGAGLLSVGGLLAILGLGTVVTAAVAALALVLPLWAAALIIGALLFAAAGIAALLSKKQLQQTDPVPQQTVASVKQDIAEVKEARP